MSYTIITIAQLLVLSWGVGLALMAVFLESHGNRSMNTDVQLLALWLLLFLGWLK